MQILILIDRDTFEGRITLKLIRLLKLGRLSVRQSLGLGLGMS